MSNCIRWQWPLAAALLVLAVGAETQAEKTFRWKVEKGDQFDVVLDQNLKQTMKVAGQTIDVGTTLQMTMSWDVKEVGQDDFLMNQTIKRITMKMKGRGLDGVNYDSAAKEELTGVAAQIATAFQPMIDVPIEQKMSLQGKVLSIEIPKKALEGIQRNPLLSSLFSEEAMSEMMKKVSPELPTEAVKKGYEWEQKSSNVLPIGTMVVTSNYKYTGEKAVEGKTLDVFDVSATMKFKSDDKAAGPFSPTIDIEKQNLTGKIFFDHQAGRIMKTTADQNFDMKVKVGEQEMTQSMTSDVVMTITPVQPEANE